MPSIPHNLSQSGSSCVGCARTSDQVMLMRLRTYARSLVCAACFMNPKYALCHNEVDGHRCGHDPHPPGKKNPTGKCPYCPCAAWRHGLESEYDRQFADTVGLKPTFSECKSFGSQTCGRIILAGTDGAIPRLCPKCEREWIEAYRQGAREVGALLNIDEKTETRQ